MFYNKHLLSTSYPVKALTFYESRSLSQRRHSTFAHPRFAKMSKIQTQPRPKTLNFITGNANKLAEVRAILADVHTLQMQSRDVPGLNEIQGTIEEVAIDKASKAAAVVSGFCFEPSVGCTSRHVQVASA